MTNPASNEKNPMTCTEKKRIKANFAKSQGISYFEIIMIVVETGYGSMGGKKPFKWSIQLKKSCTKYKTLKILEQQQQQQQQQQPQPIINLSINCRISKPAGFQSWFRTQVFNSGRTWMWNPCCAQHGVVSWAWFGSSRKPWGWCRCGWVGRL